MQIRKLNDIVLLVILFICLPSFLWGQADTQASSDDKNSQAQFEQAVEAARKNIDSLEMDLDAEKRMLKEDSNQQQIYRTQINSLRNFLFVPDISISVIEKGVEGIDISLSLIKSKIQRMTEKEGKARQNISTAKNKIDLIDQRIQESASFKVKDMVREPGIKDFKSYGLLLKKQLTIFQRMSDLLTSGIKTHSYLLKSLEDIQMTLRKEIKDKKGMLLFTNEWLSMKWSQLKEYLNLRGVMVISDFMLFSFFFFQGLSILRYKQSCQNILTKRAGYPLVVLEKSLLLIFWIPLAGFFAF